MAGTHQIYDCFVFDKNQFTGVYVVGQDDQPNNKIGQDDQLR